MCAFDDPSNFAQATTMGLAAASNRCRNAVGMKQSAIFVVVIAAICINALRLLEWAAAAARDGRDRSDQRFKLGDVVAIGASQDRGERCAIGIGDEMVLGAWSRTISGVRTCF